MYTEGPEPIRSATDPTPFANPSARLSVPTRTMHANATAHAVVRVRRVRRVASRSRGLGMPGAHRTPPNKHSAGGPSTRVRKWIPREPSLLGGRTRWLEFGPDLVPFPQTPALFSASWA